MWRHNITAASFSSPCSAKRSISVYTGPKSGDIIWALPWLHLLILIVSSVDILVNDMKSLWAGSLWLSHSLSMTALSSTYEWSWRAADTVRVPLRQRFSVTFSVQTCSEITACLSISADHVSLGSLLVTVTGCVWRQCWPDSHLLCYSNYQLLFHSLQSLNETPVKEQHKHRDKSWACDELQYGLYSQWGWSLVRLLWMTAQKPKALG